MAARVVLLKISQILPFLFSNPKALYLHQCKTKIPTMAWRTLPDLLSYYLPLYSFLSSLPYSVSHTASHLFFARSQSSSQNLFTYLPAWIHFSMIDPLITFRDLLRCHFPREAFCDHPILKLNSFSFALWFSCLLFLLYISLYCRTI